MVNVKNYYLYVKNGIMFRTTEIINPKIISSKNSEFILNQEKNTDNYLIFNNDTPISLVNLQNFLNENITDSALNNLNGSEWTKHSKSVLTFNSPITEKRRIHGAAFPIDLAKYFIEIYSKEGDVIFDPFAGVGTTLDASNILKRHSIGIELNNDFVELFKKGIDKKDGKINSDYKRIIINNTAINIDKVIPKNTIDFVLTSPPYANLLNNIREKFADKDYNGNPYKNQSRKLAKPYSKNDNDFGNFSYIEYLKNIQLIFKKLFFISKEGAYNVWVVRDYRNVKENIPYVNLHGDIIQCAINENWKLWDTIIWDQSNQRKLVRLGGPKSRRFYFNIGYSFILVFRKNMRDEKF